MFKKTFFVVVSFINLASLGLDAAQQKIKSDDLSNMIIEGENRLRVKEKSPEPTWQFDAYKDVGVMVADESLFLGFKPPAVSEPAISYPAKLATKKTASPWFDTIMESPILTLRVKLPKIEKKVSWMFLVKDSQGKEFYRMKKQGVIPQEITWDGFGAGKKPLMTGQDYTYSLSIIDEAGNPQYDTGKAFRIDAFRYASGGKQVVSFVPAALFQGDAELKFSKSGVNALVQVKDFLRPNYQKRVEVVSYDDDLKFAQARSQSIVDFLVKELDWVPSKITAKAAALSQGQGYRHVEIQSK